jgi:hypothetical protein
VNAAEGIKIDPLRLLLKSFCSGREDLDDAHRRRAL